MVALTVRRRSGSEQIRSLAAALAAGICGLAVSFAFFDALAFPTVAALTALAVGLVDALWRIVRDERTDRVLLRLLGEGSAHPAHARW
jgi:hypothetical protein